MQKNGKTGGVTGPHLDFHVKINGDSVLTSVSNHFTKNPLDNFLPYDGWVSTNGETVYIKSTAYTLPKYGVDPTPHLSFSSDCTKPTGKLTQGKPFGLSGSISSYPNLSRVWGGVYNRDGSKTKQYRDINPNSTYCNLAKDFDPYIIFNYLPVGYYTYKIEATTTDGQYAEIHSDFQIGDPPPSTYTVSLNANGGSVSPTSITVSANGTYSGLSTPSRTGYDFTGWFTASSGGDKKENGSPIASNSDHSLYAHWSAKKVTVTFHRNQNGNDTDTVQEVFTYGTSNQKFGYNTDGSGRYKKMNDPSVGFGESSVNLKVGETHLTKVNQTNVIYKSSDENIATVSSDGVITGVGAGEAFILIFNEDYDVVQVKVTVESNVIAGDCNSDGQFTVADIIMLQQWLINGNTVVDDWKAADLSEDGRLNTMDLVLMKRKLINQ